MKLYILAPNKTKYLVPSKTLINPSILLNLIRKDSAPITLLYEMLQTKIFPHDF